VSPRSEGSTPSSSLVELLRVLARNDVESIVVGMLAAVAQGAPLLTEDVDVVHRRTPENVERLLAALPVLEATLEEIERAGRG
jgi:hypothetical protein